MSQPNNNDENDTYDLQFINPYWVADGINFELDISLVQNLTPGTDMSSFYLDLFSILPPTAFVHTESPESDEIVI